jgi:MYXO-CTERM domain-containing protein
MKRSIQSLALLAALGLAPASRGAVLITEVLYNESGSDVAGEWVELHNTGGAPVDLSGYKFGDEETQGGDSESGGMWQFPAGTTMAPGQTYVIATGAARFQSLYGFAPDFEVTPTDDAIPDMVGHLGWVDPAEPNAMANGNDQVLLLGPSDEIVDMVSWGNAFAFDPGLPDGELDGQSYERISLFDTDTAADWQFGTPNSPGTVPTSVPEPAGLGILGLGGIALLRRRRVRVTRLTARATRTGRVARPVFDKATLQRSSRGER